MKADWNSTNPMELMNPDKAERWGRELLNRLKILTRGNKAMIEVEMGDRRHKKTRKYLVSRDNLKSITDYTKHLLVNSIAKPLTTGHIAMHLVHFADFCGSKPFKKVKKEDIEGFFEKYINYSESYKLTVKRVIKPFFRWLYGMTKRYEYPEVADWIYTGRKGNNIKLPEILTMEEIEKMIKACDNFRDRALISTLYDSGCRNGELMCLRIRDLNFNEYGAEMVVTGKTGSRPITLVSSVTDLKAWLNIHPRKDEPEAPLFCSLKKNNKGNPLGSSSLDFIVKEIAKKSKINKRVYPHIFRHTRATHLSQYLTEQELKVNFGWTRNSNMASIYVHLSGKDVGNKILQISGIKPKTDEKPPIIPTVKCYRCGETNSIGNNFCLRCSAPLTDKGIQQTEQTLEFLSKVLPHLAELNRERKLGNELDDVAEIFKTLAKEKTQTNNEEK